MYWLLFAASLVMPCIMLVLGLRWLGHPPASKNAFFAFRSDLSLRSEETWRYAHHYIGKTWVHSGLILLVVTAAAMWFGRKYYEMFLLWLIVLQGVLFAFSLFPVDGALLRKFGPEIDASQEAIPPVTDETTREDSAPSNPEE